MKDELIDTKEIKNHWNTMASGSIVYLDVERDTVFKLCDSHDELERKLKIAEEALLVVSDQVECCCHEVEELPDEGIVCGECLIKDALKQIRGE